MISCTKPIKSLPLGVCLTRPLMQLQDNPKILETINETEQLTIYTPLNGPNYIKIHNIRLRNIDLQTISSI